jgi:PilZ domain
MSDPVPQNRRQSRRHQPKRTTKIFCYKNAIGLGANVALSILDVSETGIRLQVREPLKQGLEVEINLDGLNHRRTLKVLGKIVWSVPAADGICLVGVQFNKPISYADYLLLTKS